MAWISSWAFARLARLASSILNSSAVTAMDRGEIDDRYPGGEQTSSNPDAARSLPILIPGLENLS